MEAALPVWPARPVRWRAVVGVGSGSWRGEDDDSTATMRRVAALWGLVRGHGGEAVVPGARRPGRRARPVAQRVVTWTDMVVPSTPVTSMRTPAFGSFTPTWGMAGSQ